MGTQRGIADTLGVAALVTVLLLATSPMLPMVWDEGDAIERAAEIPHAWPYTTHNEGHPAFYGLVIATGQAISHTWLPPLQSARFGPILLFGLAVGVMFRRLRMDYSLAAAWGAIASLLLMPRLFAHAHFASFDGPLVSCWILAWAAFVVAWKSEKTTRPWHAACASIAFGVALGMTMSCKATGWLAIVPFVLWAVAYRDRKAFAAVAIGLPVALLTFFALNPPLWGAPVQGIETFFQLNLCRGANAGLNISTQFFGRMYNLDVHLPWYNTLVWTAITVPVGILCVAAIGVVAAGRHWRTDPQGILILANWLILLIVRAIPGTPPHDAERLILPSFAFLAILSGLGCDVLVRWRRWATALLLVIGCGSLSSVAWYAPQWLSYYNLTVGGLRGATALGMEPTYYWDALDQTTLDWLANHCEPGEKVAFAAAPEDNLRLLRAWGKLRVPTDEAVAGKYRWYVLQRRPSAMQIVDVWLTQNARPVFQKTIRSGGWGPWQLDVPLLEIYDYADFEQARRQP